MSRDLGLNHGAGKGDADRTDRKKFVEGLQEIKGFDPKDRKGFKKVGLGRYRKSYGAPSPTPPSLHRAHDALTRGLLNSSGCSSDH